MDRLYTIITKSDLLDLNKMLKKYDEIQIVSITDSGDAVAVRIPNEEVWLCKNIPMNIADYNDEKDYSVNPDNM